MDYGYQVLRHIIQQVFGNLGPAARITIVPILLSYIVSGLILYSIAGSVFHQLMQLQASGVDPVELFASDAEAWSFTWRVFLATVLCVLVLLVGYSWAAVGWHRYVLLEEPASGVAARWNGAQIKSYVGAVLRMFLMLFVIGLGVGFVVGFVLAIATSLVLAQFLTIAMNVAFTWVAARIGLVLPSAALGTYMKLGESWAATGPVASAILLPIIVIPVGFAIVFGILGYVPVFGVVLVFVAIWLQLLINLALMTTLYGNLIEGRQLN